MRKTAVFTIAMLAATSANAEVCREVENDLDRLACYDLESGRTPVAEVVETPVSSAWNVSVSTSEMTDQTTVVLSTTTEGSISCGFTPRPAALILRCSENTTVLYISTSCQMTSNLRGYGDVTYRFDDASAQTRGFTESSDSSALGLWNGGKSIPFIKKMFGKSTALFRFTPFGDSPTTARFDITGLEEAIAPLREACHW